MKSYDYIICGFGCAGISLVQHLINSPLRDKKILVIDADSKTKNDRTWCYWANEPAPFHPKSAPLQYWDTLQITKDNNTTYQSLESLKYYHIRSSDFYKEAFEAIQNFDNVTFLQDHVENIISVDSTNAQVKLRENGVFSCSKAFTSIPITKSHNENQIKQIFVGWELRSDEEVFDPTSATFMHFDTDSMQSNDFFYVLPFSKKHALIEFTTYTQDTCEEEVMENEISQYLQKFYPNQTFEITGKEKGSIPMSTFSLVPKNDHKSIVYLGTIGGCTKASTGFTFYNIQKHCKQIVENLALDKPILHSYINKSQRFGFYDNILLNIIKKWPKELPELFYTMFSKNKAPMILKFLNEETSFLEEVNILMRLKFGIYIKSLLRYERH